MPGRVPRWNTYPLQVVNLGLDPGAHPRSEARARRWLAAGGAVYVIQDVHGGPWSLSWAGLRTELLPGTRRVLRVLPAPAGAP